MVQLRPKQMHLALVASSKEDAAKRLVMQYRIERAARYTMYIAILIFAATLVGSVYAIIYPLRLSWRNG